MIQNHAIRNLANRKNINMKTNLSIIIVASVALLVSCGQKDTNKQDSISADSVSMKKEPYSYYISDNIVIKSSVTPKDFNLDSIDSYEFVKDYEGNVYQATLIDTKKPPIFQEGIYQDITDGKRKFFIYDNDTYDRNLIYIGTLLSSDQLIAAGFIPKQVHSDTVVATRWVNLETPTQRKTDMERINQEWHNQIKDANIELLPME